MMAACALRSKDDRQLTANALCDLVHFDLLPSMIFLGPSETQGLFCRFA